jgi:hypothetical protein
VLVETAYLLLYASGASAAVVLALVLIITVFAWIHFHKLLAQRLFIATVIVALSCVALAFVGGVALIDLLLVHRSSSFPSSSEVQTDLLLTLVLPIISLVYAVSRMWRAR